MANPNPNLPTRFQPGVSGNPGGRPKGRISLTRLIQERLKDRHFMGKPNSDGRLNAEWLVDAMIYHAVSGNANLIQQILDRNDGKIPDVEPEPEVDLKAVARRMQERRKERERKRDKPT